MLIKAKDGSVFTCRLAPIVKEYCSLDFVPTNLLLKQKDLSEESHVANSRNNQPNYLMSEKIDFISKNEEFNEAFEKRSVAEGNSLGQGVPS